MQQRLLPVLRRALLGLARPWAAPASRRYPPCRRCSFLGYGARMAGTGAAGRAGAGLRVPAPCGGRAVRSEILLLCLAGPCKERQRGRGGGHLVRPGMCPRCPECGFTPASAGSQRSWAAEPGGWRWSLLGAGAGGAGVGGPCVQGPPGRARCAAGLVRSSASDRAPVDKAGSVISRMAVGRLGMPGGLVLLGFFLRPLKKTPEFSHCLTCHAFLSHIYI